MPNTQETGPAALPIDETLRQHDTQAALAMERDGVVREAPALTDIVDDFSRTNEFSHEAGTRAAYNRHTNRRDRETMTEHEGLVGLNDFLETAALELETARPDLAAEAREIQTNLAFIGEHELQEAMTGVGDFWKQYLDEDPKRTICVPTDVFTTSAGEYMRKSDSYLLERVLKTFSDEDRDRLAGRFTTSLESIESEPEDTKVVMLEDWIISGRQMNARMVTLSNQEPAKFDEYKDSFEANLVFAGAGLVEQGFSYNLPAAPPEYTEKHTLPLRAYFSNESGRVTGTHSSVDYRFEEEIGHMVESMIKEREGRGEDASDVDMPPLTNIVRDYRYERPKVVIDKKGHITDRVGGSHPLRRLKAAWYAKLDT